MKYVFNQLWNKELTTFSVSSSCMAATVYLICHYWSNDADNVNWTHSFEDRNV